MQFEHLLLLSADMSTRREMTDMTNWQRWDNANGNAGQKTGRGGHVGVP